MQSNLTDPENEQIESLQLRMIYAEPLEILDRQRKEARSPISAPLAESELSAQRQKPLCHNPDYTLVDFEENPSCNALRPSDLCQIKHETQEINRSKVCEVPKKQTVDEALIRFASAGGPDLADLRGFCGPQAEAQNEDNVFQDSPMNLESRNELSSLASSEQRTSISRNTKTKKISTYDSAFELHVLSRGIYHRQRSAVLPNNLDDIKERLGRRRASLSSLQFTEEHFDDFWQNNEDARSEIDIQGDVFPYMLGSKKIPHSADAEFSNLAPLTDGTIVACKPDYYEGAFPTDLNEQVRKRLEQYIIPSGDKTRPCLPNFFLELKSPDGKAAVAKRQAWYDGAMGARAIQQVRSFVTDNETPDGNAYVIAMTYVSGSADEVLKIYAVFPRLVEAPKRLIEYRMILLASHDMAYDVTTFRQGATALRNAREWAQEVRKKLIKEANTKVAS